MKIEIDVQEDENFKIVKQESPVVPEPKKDDKPQPTLDNPKGHPWFDGTSWGTK